MNKTAAMIRGSASEIRITPMLNDRIDGLLLFVEAGLGISVVSTAWRLWRDLRLLARSIDLLVAILGSGSIVAPVAMGMTVIDLVVLLGRKDRLFPRLMVRYLNALICGPVSIVLGFSAGEVVFEALGSIGICIVWIPYFRKSPRVKETFIR